MPRTTPEFVPSYRRHKQSGQAIVTLSYKDHLLGPYGTPESKVRYHELLARWLQGGRKPLETLPIVRAADTPAPGQVRIETLCDAYQQFADGYYASPGRRTNKSLAFRIVLRDLRELFGPTPAEQFSPSKLKTLREVWIKRCSRTTVNAYMMLIRQVFRWAVAEEMIPPAVLQTLACIAPLKRGKSAARESEPVRPVPDADVDAIKPFVSSTIWALIQLQRFTGARGGELFGLRAKDIDMSKPIWTYSPQQHKTAHHGKMRLICFGPRCQEVLSPFLGRGAIDQPLFRPRDSNAERKRVGAKGGRRPNQQPSRRKSSRVMRDQYDDSGYHHAIRRACQKAGVSHWHPHQLRHSFATKVRSEFGLEAARAAVGHTSIDTTLIYAERDQEQTKLIAARCG